MAINMNSCPNILVNVIPSEARFIITSRGDQIELQVILIGRFSPNCMFGTRNHDETKLPAYFGGKDNVALLLSRSAVAFGGYERTPRLRPTVD